MQTICLPQQQQSGSEAEACVWRTHVDAPLLECVQDAVLLRQLIFLNRSVESMLETFCDMNLEMARTGNFSTQIGKEQLLRLVAHNNVILVCTYHVDPGTMGQGSR